jgi:hypothetical protein
MVRKAGDFYNKPVYAVNDETGKLSEFIFDERSWTIRYMVVALEKGFKLKDVLVSPVAFESFNDRNLKIQLTKDEILKCSDKTTAEPADTQQKKSSERFRTTAQSFGSYNERFETVLFPPKPSISNLEDEKKGNPYLRSSGEISRCKILTEDSVWWRVEDLLFDDRIWNFRFILVRPVVGSDQETRALIVFGVDHIEWETETIYVGCRSDYLMHCPKFDPLKHVNIKYEDFLGHYNMASKNG